MSRKPPWLKVRLPGGAPYGRIKQALAEGGLHTVCEEARCPNQGECWAQGTATFLILGPTCTRGCRFCAVTSGDPKGHVDEEEPDKVARAAAAWSLKYVVLTSVDRDDLPDGGAAHFARTVTALRSRVPGVRVECLVPDFSAREADIRTVLQAGPHVFAHNVEVVRRLTPLARDRRASFDRSLEVLRMARRLGAPLTKSSLMLGLGESEEDVRDALHALKDAGVDMVTLGQYLQPSPRQLAVLEYVAPERFAEWESVARNLGFSFVAAGPLVRSSYRAAELFADRALQRPPEV